MSDPQGNPQLRTFYTVRVLTQDDNTSAVIVALKTKVTEGGGTVFVDMQHMRGFVFHTAIDAPNPLKGANVEYGDGVLMIEAFKQEGNTANTQVPEH